MIVLLLFLCLSPISVGAIIQDGFIKPQVKPPVGNTTKPLVPKVKPPLTTPKIDCNKLSQDTQKLVDDLNNAEKRLEELSKRLEDNDCDSYPNALSEFCVKTLAEAMEVDQKIQEIKKTIEENNKKLSENKCKPISLTPPTIANCVDHATDLEKEILKLQATLEGLKNTLKDLQESLQSLQSNLANCISTNQPIATCNNLKNQVTRLSQQIAEQQLMIQLIESQIANHRNSIKEIQKFCLEKGTVELNP